MGAPLYDSIGRTYVASRRPDPRIFARIRRALGDARSVVNVGAGAGAYEPGDLDVVAVEPSEVMLAQRPAGAAPAVRATAEHLPFEDASFDAAMAILSDHHWSDRAAGLRELRRVARRRVVLLNADPATAPAFWLTRDYLPAVLDLIPPRLRIPGAWQRDVRAALGAGARFEVVPVPHDCTDGFYAAYWRRPDAYLDEAVRANISVFSRVAAADVERALAALAADLATGRWHEVNAGLLDRDALDVGMRLVIAETAQTTAKARRRG